MAPTDPGDSRPATAPSTTRRSSTTPAGSASSPTWRAGPSHALVRQGLAVLERLAHRGASGAEVATGDGAGILTQLPAPVPRCRRGRPRASSCRTPAPTRPGACSCPTDADDAEKARSRVRGLADEEGLRGPRLARGARSRRDPRRDGPAGPAPDRAGLRRPDGAPAQRRAHRARPAGLRAAQAGRARTSTASTSRRCRPGPSCTRACSPATSSTSSTPTSPTSASSRAWPSCTRASRTNTFPSWPLAHPYRLPGPQRRDQHRLAGNRNWMRAREALLATDLIEGDLSRIFPICTPGASDSRLLRRGARAPAPGRPDACRTRC